MNIVFCRYRNICEPDYIEAFKALGVNVVEVFINEIKASSLGEKAEKLGEQVRKATPMFVFSINYFPYVSIVCQSLGIKYVSISVTCPMVEIYNNTIRNSYNRVFLFDRQQYLSICDENPAGIFYLPLGAAVSRIDAVLEDADPVYKYDVSFVGSLYNEKDPLWNPKDAHPLAKEKSDYFEGIIRQQIDMSASGQDYLEEQITTEDVAWIKEVAQDFYPSDMCVRNIDGFVAVNNYLSPHMAYLERIKLLNMLAGQGGYGVHLFTKSDTSRLRGVETHGGVETLREMPQVFFQSRINLNLSTRSIKTGIPQRVWDVLASRGFLLTNYQAEIPEYFKVGEHLAAYESADELKELVSYYLEHEDEREAIAEAGYELVKAEGTVLNRVMGIIKKIC